MIAPKIPPTTPPTVLPTGPKIAPTTAPAAILANAPFLLGLTSTFVSLPPSGVVFLSP